jgi:hypothetical protein
VSIDRFSRLVDWLDTTGVPQAVIHRCNVLVGASLQGCALVTFGLVSNAWVATTALCLNRLFSTGMSSWNSQNYLEVCEKTPFSLLVQTILQYKKAWHTENDQLTKTGSGQAQGGNSPKG